MTYSALRVREQGTTCFVQIHRPEANNAINSALLDELGDVLARAERTSTTAVVLEGLPEVFCFGADFSVISEAARLGQPTAIDPEPMFEVFHRMAFGSFMTFSHVRGKANAGGVGFIAASDVVLADESATFSLSELLFGLIPAVVLPFLIRRIGVQRAHYLAGTTQTIGVQKAAEWGLVDAYDANSASLLRKHLLRTSRLSKRAIAQYKSYLRELSSISDETKRLALSTNRDAFSDPDNVAAIRRYAEHGLFPWEEPIPRSS